MSSEPSTTLSFRVDPGKGKGARAVGAIHGQVKSLAAGAGLDSYLVNQAWQIEAIEAGIADADAGKLVPHEEVKAWLLGWGRESRRAK